MKLIVQIPCYNEQDTLALTLADIPDNIPGVDTIERLIIDDGSTDETVKVAKAAGVEHIVQLPRNQGLAKAFTAGLDAAVRAGADIIVNTDADNQYNARDIPKLIQPILASEAEIVIGSRPIQEIAHFSGAKIALQKLGSAVVRKLSQTDIPDAPSGFRAFSRDAAMKLHVFSEYTYTLETIIQAGQKHMAIRSVDIRVNENLRPSRLVKSIPSYIRRSIITMIRIFVVYRPLRFFFTLGSILFLSGFFVSLRFLYYYLQGQGSGMVQSLILSTLLMAAGGMLGLAGILGDLIAVNRKLLEDVLWRIRKLEDRSTR